MLFLYTVLFADDTTVFVTGTSVADISAILSSVITAAYEWFLLSGLRLNVAKTKCMLLHSSRRIPTSALEVQFNGRTIDQVLRHKFLGVIITDTLSWSDHIDQICSKASRGLNLLHKLAWFLPRSALVCYYCVCPAPSDVCSPSVGFLKLEGLQNFAARIILRYDGYASVTLMRKELGRPTLLSRRILGKALILHRCLSGSAPEYFSSLLKPTSSVHSHLTRSSVTKGLQVPRVRTEFGRKTFAFWGAHRWNSLQSNLRNVSQPSSSISAARVCLLSYEL